MHYKFTGQERDAETGQDHFMFRNYVSAAARWTSPDPYLGSYDLTNPQSLNRYAYVLNNPMKFLDPFGLNYICSATTTGTSYDDGATSWTTTIDCIDFAGGGGDSGGGVDDGGGGDGGGGQGSGPAPKSCFNPNWLQGKVIAIEQKVAQHWGHPVGFGAGGSAGAGLGKKLGLAISGSAQMIVTPNGNAFLSYTWGGSGLTTPWLTIQSAGAGAMGGFQFSTMTGKNVTQSDLEGYGIDVAAGGGEGFGGGGDINLSSQVQGTATVGAATGGFGYGGLITKTAAIPSCSNTP
jgi:RHS repeat-associated protein